MKFSSKLIMINEFEKLVCLRKSLKFFKQKLCTRNMLENLVISRSFTTTYKLVFHGFFCFWSIAFLFEPKAMLISNRKSTFRACLIFSGSQRTDSSLDERNPQLQQQKLSDHPNNTNSENLVIFQ